MSGFFASATLRNPTYGVARVGMAKFERVSDYHDTI
jgi:hypothetical protein